MNDVRKNTFCPLLLAGHFASESGAHDTRCSEHCEWYSGTGCEVLDRLTGIVDALEAIQYCMMRDKKGESDGKEVRA